MTTGNYDGRSTNMPFSYLKTTTKKLLLNLNKLEHYEASQATLVRSIKIQIIQNLETK
jgi:hypothetical protein